MRVTATQENPARAHAADIAELTINRAYKPGEHVAKFFLMNNY
jgi:hypothetical protein